MEYNSSQEFLLYPEYGRNIQKMIRSARNEQDGKRRQAMANVIVDLMAHLALGPKTTLETRSKLWKHFFAIAEYKIDVVSPEGIQYTAEENVIHPTTITYMPINESFRHYGNHVRRLIEKAIEMENGPKKHYLISLIGSYMKMAYKTWNKDHFVTDEGVRRDLKILAKGKLDIEDETSLDVLNKKGKGPVFTPNNTQDIRPANNKNNRYRQNRNNNNPRYNDRFRNNNNNNPRRRG